MIALHDNTGRLPDDDHHPDQPDQGRSANGSGNDKGSVLKKVSKSSISLPVTTSPTSESRSTSSSGCSSGCGSKKMEPSDGDIKVVQLNVSSLHAERTKPARENLPFRGTDKYPQGLMIGLDIGSTTVKAVVIDPVTDEILWEDYQRHETKQAEKTLEFLADIEKKIPDVPTNAYRMFVTGSGGSAVVGHLGGKFVQEVNAVSLAVEKLYPEVQSVVELGGQDAKIIIFKTDEETGKKKKIPSMNDKCAGGTGAVIDKINAKLKIPTDQLCAMGHKGVKLHPVAGKCGVFAETDINNLQKQGIPPEELMASLFESIIQQNLSVLTRGHTLRPTVLLLGGPNCFIKGMRECWQHNIPITWKERGIELPDPSKPPEDYIITPDNAQYFAAIGAVEFGKIEVADEPDLGVYQGRHHLSWYVEHGRSADKQAGGTSGLAGSDEMLAAFKKRYTKTPWHPPTLKIPAKANKEIEVFIGLDGGSTSTKAVMMDTQLNLVAKSYQLSKGNPIEDTIDVMTELETIIQKQGLNPRVLGVGTTGYAKDILKDVLGADVALVETVAHTQSGLHYYPGADVIVDVGGQDIKLIILKDGRVKDFKLNTQCSAGNGYFLQSTASGFGYDVREYADIAFKAEAMPEFGYGCAVFMQSDIVDFQRQGWTASEIMAGLAAVLPKNIWLYVSQIPNIAKLGRRFILQGGTQHNLAAVKSQVDFIESRFLGTGVTPEVIVHEHCGESGAIGCAIEAHRLWSHHDLRTTFIGLQAVKDIVFRTTHDERTRCYFCKNNCLRTFIDVKTKRTPKPELQTTIDLSSRILKIGAEAGHPTRMKRVAHNDALNPKRSHNKSKVPLEQGEQRLIIATCEKGTVENIDDMREIKSGLDTIKKRYPNLIDISSREIFKENPVEDVSDKLPGMTAWNFWKKSGIRARRKLIKQRKNIRIGMPRVLNMYSMAPFFQGFFTSLGVPFKNLVWSNFTTEEMYKAGAKRGSIDPCYPSKLGIPHVHNLLYVHHVKKPLTHIFFPMIDTLPTFLHGVQDSKSCPTVVATPEATHAAFVKEGDMFAQRNIVFKKTFLNPNEPILCARQFYLDWKDDLGLTEEESLRAVLQGIAMLQENVDKMRRQAKVVLDELEREHRLGVVILARPYHNDPGVNHEICDELQKLGYPVFSQDTLPIDDEILERLFGNEVETGQISHSLNIDDVWKNSYSENTSRKIWAAKYTARHPNLVALELSSFKCGHDAPIYSVIEEIIESSGTPYFCFKDIDENKPTGSIKIRIETIAYFLDRYRETLVEQDTKRQTVEQQVAEFERQLRQQEALNHTPHGALDPLRARPDTSVLATTPL